MTHLGSSDPLSSRLWVKLPSSTTFADLVVTGPPVSETSGTSPELLEIV